jgi:large subunit ribosomal protein L15
MPNLSSLKSVKNKPSRRRLGRGAGSTKGKTSGRGHKGYKARTGSNSRLRYEGGQQPLISRIPKLKGFKNINYVDYEIINVGDIEKLSEKGKLDAKILKKKGALNKGHKLKILGNGEISSAVKVTANSFSESAKEKIEKAGGSVKIVEKDNRYLDKVVKAKAKKIIK